MVGKYLWIHTASQPGRHLHCLHRHEDLKCHAVKMYGTKLHRCSEEPSSFRRGCTLLSWPQVARGTCKPSSYVTPSCRTWSYLVVATYHQRVVVKCGDCLLKRTVSCFAGLLLNIPLKIYLGFGCVKCINPFKSVFIFFLIPQTPVRCIRNKNNSKTLSHDLL